MRRFVAPWILAVAACGPAPTDDTKDPGCGENAPTFEEVVVSDDGEAEFSDGPGRSMLVKTQASDVDGDLHEYVALVWYDNFVDGQVDGPADVELRVNQFPDKPCEIDFLTAGARVRMGTEEVPFNALVEVGLVIEDAAGNQSNGGDPLVVTFRTPTE